MSRRWGISIPCSSFPNEICLIDSGIVHPRTGEKTATPPHASRKSRAAGLAWYCRIEKVRRSIAFTEAWAEGKWLVIRGWWLLIGAAASLSQNQSPATSHQPPHFTSTEAPCSSSLALTAAASSLDTPDFT